MTHLEKLRLIASVIERHGIPDEQIICCDTVLEPDVLVRSIDYAESLVPMQRRRKDGHGSHCFGVLDGVEISALVRKESEVAV